MNDREAPSPDADVRDIDVPGVDVRDIDAYLTTNRAFWTVVNSAFTDRDGWRAWSAPEVTWGLFGVPERDVGVLGDVAGLDVIELGCGTAYRLAWLARRGARVVGVDPTPAQLETARRLMRQTGIEFPLVEAPGESVPLPNETF